MLLFNSSATVVQNHQKNVFLFLHFTEFEISYNFLLHIFFDKGMI